MLFPFFRIIVAATLLGVLTGGILASEAVTVVRPAILMKAEGASVQRLGSPSVAEPDGAFSYVTFDGVKDGLVVKGNPLKGLRQFTIQVLVRPSVNGPEQQRFVHFEDVRGHRVLLETRTTNDGTWALDTHLYADAKSKRTLLEQSKRHQVGDWHWVALIYDGNRMRHYVDGCEESAGAVSFDPMQDGEYSVGVRLTKRSWYKGDIAEIRITGEVLDPTVLQKRGDSVVVPDERH